MDSPSFFNGSNITALILFAATILFGIVGLSMLAKSNKGRFKDQAEKFGNVILAAAVIAGGMAGMFLTFGEEALGFFLN